MNKIKINYCCQKILMKKNPGGNFGNDFFRKGDWGLPQKYKKRHL